MPGSEDERDVAALGDSTRLAVVGLLRKAPRRSSDLADALSTTRPTMSRRLGVLRKAGLVEQTSVDDDARARMYQLRPERFEDVRTWVEESKPKSSSYDLVAVTSSDSRAHPRRSRAPRRRSKILFTRSP